MTIKTLGMGIVKYLKTKARNKASSEAAGWGAHLKRRSRVFKEGQDRMKGLEKQIKSGVVDRNVKSKDVFKIIKGLKKKPKGKFSTFPSEIVRTLKSKKSKAFGKGALIGGAAASGIEYKRRKDRGDYKE